MKMDADTLLSMFRQHRLSYGYTTYLTSRGELQYMVDTVYMGKRYAAAHSRLDVAVIELLHSICLADETNSTGNDNPNKE